VPAAGFSQEALTWGNATERLGAGLEDEVVDGELHALRFEGGVELFAEGEERGGVEFDFDVEVRELGLRFQQAARDGAAHIGDGDGAFLLDGALGGGEPGLRGEGGEVGRSRGTCGLGEDIGAHDAAAGAGAGEARDVELLLRGQLARQRRNLHATAGGGGGGWRGSSSGGRPGRRSGRGGGGR
jgi:hypothetical protein